MVVLEDGTSFSGWTFAGEGEVSGEVVFTTSMVGYQETLTDPSYRGQIVLFTYPLIGNYGVIPVMRSPQRFRPPPFWFASTLRTTAIGRATNPSPSSSRRTVL
jgi:carbamoyl-phosphate synthase small subunit